MSRVYYNENDPFTAAWLKELIKAKLIADGDVDDRSILDVRPNDLKSYTQCHFFAGIGVWSYALRRAGWQDDCPVWTGSCPCQPFSAAGERKGFADERHLWPYWFWLIEQSRPKFIFGEQVASKDGQAWFDLVSDDLEGLDYSIGAVPFPACSVGAPHIRKRLYWVAGETDMAGRMEQSSRKQMGLPGFSRQPREANGFWQDAEWLPCIDGKWRPVEPGASPLAYGSPNRVGRLRGYGNSLVAPQAQAFIEVVMEEFNLSPLRQDAAVRPFAERK